ncbi:MAG TPA: DNA polymerase Y family protein [Mizugakiibacter sp.]
MLWACLLLPHLALDGVRRRRPDADAPLLLLEGKPPRRVVRDLTPAAARAGLRAGLPLAAAQALLPGVAHVDHDARETQRLRDLLVAWAYRYSSMVALDGEDALLVEVGASFGLFGPWPRFERALREELAALGITHRIAAAPTPLGAAVLAAHADGTAVLAPDALRRALAAVPLAHARLPADDVEALARMGVRTLRQLTALPRASLARRFGPALLDHLDRLHGDAPDPRELYRPPDVFEARVELAYETHSHEALLFPLRRLTADLAAYLTARAGGVQRFRVWLEHEDHAPTAFEVGLLTPERDAARLLEFARGRLERCVVPAAVRGLGVQARELPPFVPAARDLFDARPPEAMDWDALRERLRARLGEDALHQLAPFADARPECAQRRVARLTREPAPLAVPPRPAWLLPRPLPLREARVRVLAGPERIEAGWWDGGDVRRDYYVIETSQGQRAWVYCAAGERGPWMLHGWFA